MPERLARCPSCGYEKWSRSPRPKCGKVKCERYRGNMKIIDDRER